MLESSAVQVADKGQRRPQYEVDCTPSTDSVTVIAGLKLT